MTNTMTPGMSLVFLFFGIFVLTVKGQPASQSGKNGVKATSTSPIDDCTCMPYYLCNNTNEKNKGINQRPCPTYIEVCCNIEDIIEPPMLLSGKKSGCGRRNVDGVAFQISNLREGQTQFGEFPWMVALLKEEGFLNKVNVYHCGGALIHAQMIVTAAHCVDGNDKVFRIRAGEWDVYHTDESFPYQEREVQTIIVHPQYYAGTLHNDIALLYLKSPFDITSNVEPVCLPLQDTEINVATCYVTGWGKIDFSKKDFAIILKKIELPLVPNNECQEQIRTSAIGKLFELHKSFVCAGGVSGKYTCTGDDGSPLVCPIPGQDERYYQVGIVAWHSKCGEDNLPGVFVNLPLFRDWIDSQMKSFGLDVTSYRY